MCLNPLIRHKMTAPADGRLSVVCFVLFLLGFLHYRFYFVLNLTFSKLLTSKPGPLSMSLKTHQSFFKVQLQRSRAGYTVAEDIVP